MLPTENNRLGLARAIAAQRLLGEAQTEIGELITTLSTGVQTPVKEDIRAAHRRAHRMDNPAKIEADPRVARLHHRPD